MHLFCAPTTAEFYHKWVYKRDLLCNGNWPINRKHIFAHIIFSSIERSFLGYAKIKLQSSISQAAFKIGY